MSLGLALRNQVVQRVTRTRQWFVESADGWLLKLSISLKISWDGEVPTTPLRHAKLLDAGQLALANPQKRLKG